MILLDTQALLWFRLGDPRLGPNARREAENALRAGQLAVSVVSFWEVGWLLAKKRIDLKLDIERWRAELLADGLVEIPLTGEMAVRAAKLPNLHPDPADRFIVAAALDGHRLLTADRLILDWPGDLERIRADA